MKKLSLFGLALALCIGAAQAAPIDVNQAKSYGLKFVQNTLGQKSAELSLAYTQATEAGVDALYIFNHDHGYVVVAADDRAFPILGYSEDSPFDVENIPEGLRYYHGYYARQIQYAIDNDLPVEQEIADQWYLLDKEGVISRTRMDRVVTPLLSTTWNQDYPYNYYAPTSSSYWAPGGHCYAGCVATAMSQVMKYWNWPETGVGEHSYSTSSNGGTLSANFGETTYNWSIMPNQLGYQANEAALAVALLMYHCGIAVDMDYAPDGSGAHTEDVAPAVIEYFRYGAGTYVDNRDSYSKAAWEDILIAQLDRSIPMVYAGSDTDGGHAFNCDGYNAQRYFHFNWGWSGSYNNTYYQIDALNTGNGHFNSYQRAVLDMFPDYIYNALVPAIETMEVTVADAMTHTVAISWTVPTESVSGDPLESIEKIELKRNGQVIHDFNNPVPGEVVNYEDNVSDYGCYEYTICGVNNGYEGELFSQTALLGPNCTWKFVCQTTNFQGWNDGKIQVVGGNGTVVKEVTMTSSTNLSQKFQMPEGDFTLNWVAPASAVSSLTITLKNSAGQTAYNFSGSSTQLNGTIYSGSNDCEGCQPPTNLTGEYEYENGVFGTLLTWDCDYSPSKYKVYRSDDGEEYAEIAQVTDKEYFDEAAVGEYYYKVTAYSSSCESTPASTTDNTDYVYVMVTALGENAVNTRLYPNPTSGLLCVEGTSISHVAVYNLMGQKVYEGSFNGNENVIDMMAFGCGMYLVKVTSPKGTLTQKVTVIE